MAVTRDYKYKILENLDLSHNTIYDVDLITNPENSLIHSDKTLTETGTNVVIKDSNSKNIINVSANSTEISGVKLDVESAKTEINSPTDIKQNLTVSGSKIDATTPADIFIGNNTGKSEIIGRDISSYSAEYAKTTDTSIDISKTYYEYNLTTKQYTIVSNPVSTELSNYYELSRPSSYTAQNLYFSKEFGSNNLYIYWDNNRQSIVFAKREQ